METEHTAKEWKELGNSYVQEQKYKEALDCYTKAIEIDPNDPILYSNRSLMHSNLNEFDLAIEDAEIAIELKPDYSKAYLRLGKAYEGKNELEKAFQIYMKGYKKDRNNTQLFEAANKIKKVDISKDLDEIKEENEGKCENKNLIEKYALNKRVELTFVRQTSDYRIVGKIEEVNGGFVLFIKENGFNNTQEKHIININNIIDVHILE